VNLLYIYIKRLIDIILSGLGIILLSPIFLIIALLIKIDSQGNVFFKQKRVGKNKTHFNILKFRTMKSETPSDMPTHLLGNATSHITNIGNFLRKSSLDELPQLINIFKGDMSIVGPRPALWNQYDLLTERDKFNANDVYPGLTGLAQISGRDELSIYIKAELDGDYVLNMGFWMDIKCILGTVRSVLKRDGIVEGDSKDRK